MLCRPCDVESLEDFYRYYLHSWVGSPEDKFTTPLYVTSMVGPKVRLQPLQVVDGRFTTGAVVDLTFEELRNKVDFGRPDVGMITNGPTIGYMSLATPREAKKGFRVKGSKIHDFNIEEFRNTPLKCLHHSDAVEWVWQIFNPTYKGVGEIYRDLDAGKYLGAPVSRTVGLYLTSKSSCPIVAYKRWSVGFMSDPRTITIFTPFALYVAPIAEQTGLTVNLV